MLENWMEMTNQTNEATINSTSSPTLSAGIFAFSTRRFCIISLDFISSNANGLVIFSPLRLVPVFVVIVVDLSIYAALNTRVRKVQMLLRTKYVENIKWQASVIWQLTKVDSFSFCTLIWTLKSNFMYILRNICVLSLASICLLEWMTKKSNTNGSIADHSIDTGRCSVYLFSIFCLPFNTQCIVYHISLRFLCLPISIIRWDFWWGSRCILSVWNAQCYERYQTSERSICQNTWLEIERRIKEK